MIFRNLIAAAAYYGVAQLAVRAQHSKQVMRRSLMSAGLLALAILLLYLACAFLLGAVFFSLAEMNTLTQPALVTAGIALLGAILFWYESKRLLGLRHTK